MGFLVAGIFNGFGFGFCAPTLQALAVRRAPTNRWGAATGTFFAAFDMGYGLGAIVWGFVAEAIGYQAISQSFAAIRQFMQYPIFSGIFRYL